MFGSRKRKPNGDNANPPVDTPAAPQGVASANAVSLRDAVFDKLKSRVGAGLAADMREDFDEHIDDDPVDGVEAAWMCLSMKLIEAVDRLNDAVSGRPEGSTAAQAEASEASQARGGAISPFTVYRKDA